MNTSAESKKLLSKVEEKLRIQSLISNDTDL